MRVASFSTLLLAAVLSGPALWRCFVTQDIDQRTALVRFLIAIPVAAIMIGLLHSLTAAYTPKEDDTERRPLRVTAVAGEPMPQRRATDQPDGAQPDGDRPDGNQPDGDQ